MYGIRVVSGSVWAKTPIFHGGNEKTGSVSLLNRIRFLTEDGTQDIPVISGNAIRGMLRRELFADFLRRVGYEIDVSQKGGQRLYHALFTGGVLETIEEKSSGIIDIGLKKQIVRLMPPARLLGFSIGNQIIEGKLKVGMALPICNELSDYLPDNIHPKVSIYDMLSSAFQTRRDDLRNEREENEQAVQMLIEHEVFIPGTVFYHEFRLEDPDEIDMSCLARMIELWKQKPVIGGKSSIGFGELKVNYDIEASPEKYLEFLRENKEEIYALLKELEER